MKSTVTIIHPCKYSKTIIRRPNLISISMEISLPIKFKSQEFYLIVMWQALLLGWEIV